MNNDNWFDGLYGGGIFDGVGWYDEHGRPQPINCRCVFRPIIDQEELDREGDRLVEFAKELLQ